MVYDFEGTRYVLKWIFEFYYRSLGVKLLSYFNVAYFEKIR